MGACPNICFLQEACQIKGLLEGTGGGLVALTYPLPSLPPGKLTAEQIRAGYCSLQKVEACLQEGSAGQALLDACNEFYTRIPHDFGSGPPHRPPPH